MLPSGYLSLIWDEMPVGKRGRLVDVLGVGGPGEGAVVRVELSDVGIPLLIGPLDPVLTVRDEVEPEECIRRPFETMDILRVVEIRNFRVRDVG